MCFKNMLWYYIVTCTPLSARKLSCRCCAFSGGTRPWRNTSAPARDSAVAIARPIPEVEPVTRAAFPDNRRAADDAMGELAQLGAWKRDYGTLEYSSSCRSNGNMRRY